MLVKPLNSESTLQKFLLINGLTRLNKLMQSLRHVFNMKFYNSQFWVLIAKYLNNIKQRSYKLLTHSEDPPIIYLGKNNPYGNNALQFKVHIIYL